MFTSLSAFNSDARPSAGTLLIVKLDMSSFMLIVKLDMSSFKLIWWSMVPYQSCWSDEVLKKPTGSRQISGQIEYYWWHNCNINSRHWCMICSPFWPSQNHHLLSGHTSYRKIAWSQEAARFGFRLSQSPWKFTDPLATTLPRYLFSFRAIRSLYHLISRLRDFTTFGCNTPVRLVNRDQCWFMMGCQQLINFWISVVFKR